VYEVLETLFFRIGTWGRAASILL